VNVNFRYRAAELFLRIGLALTWFGAFQVVIGARSSWVSLAGAATCLTVSGYLVVRDYRSPNSRVRAIWREVAEHRALRHGQGGTL